MISLASPGALLICFESISEFHCSFDEQYRHRLKYATHILKSEVRHSEQPMVALYMAKPPLSPCKRMGCEPKITPSNFFLKILLFFILGSSYLPYC